MKLIDRLSNTPAEKVSWEIRIQVWTDPLKVPSDGKKGSYVTEARALAKFLLGIDIEVEDGCNLFWGDGSTRTYEEGAFTIPAGSSLTFYSTQGDVKVADWSPLCEKLKGHYDFLRSSEQVECYDRTLHCGDTSVDVEACFKFYK